jgi:hypothetical protein
MWQVCHYFVGALYGFFPLRLRSSELLTFCPKRTLVPNFSCAAGWFFLLSTRMASVLRLLFLFAIGSDDFKFHFKRKLLTNEAETTAVSVHTMTAIELCY